MLIHIKKSPCHKLLGCYFDLLKNWIGHKILRNIQENYTYIHHSKSNVTRSWENWNDIMIYMNSENKMRLIRVSMFQYCLNIDYPGV